jgi:hypothetical protein
VGGVWRIAAAGRVGCFTERDVLVNRGQAVPVPVARVTRRWRSYATRWSRTGAGTSALIRRGCTGGSVATVEAVCVPQATGALRPPRLLLRGLQDVVADGRAGGHAVVAVGV